MRFLNLLNFIFLFASCEGFLDVLTVISLSKPLRSIVSKDSQCQKDLMFWLRSLDIFISSTASRCKPYDFGCYSDKLNLSSPYAFAAKQLDSFGRIPSNVLGMTTVSMGSWEECTEVKAPNRPEYKTQFCYIRFALHPNLTRLFLNTRSFSPFSSSIFQLSTHRQSKRQLKRILRLGLVQSQLITVNAKKENPKLKISAKVRMIKLAVAHCMHYLMQFAKRIMMPTTAYENCETQIAFRWSVCLPKSCSQKEIVELLQSINMIIDDSLKFCTASCRPEHPPKKGLSFWIVISYVSLGAVLVLMSSIYDYCTESEAYSGSQKKMGTKMLMAFSMYTNGSAIMNVKKSNKAIMSVHCIKVIAVTWVIIGHALGLYVVSDNPLAQTKLPDNILNDIFINGFFSVDTFFFLGGFLTSYSFFCQIAASPNVIYSAYYWSRFYLHRLIRIAPAYYLFLGFTIELFDSVRIGPIPLDEMINIGYCRKYWWHNVFFINDLFDRLGQCMGHSWYIAADMKFFMLTPLIFISLYYKPYIAYVISIILLCASTAANYLSYYIYDFPINYIGFFANISDKDLVWKFERYLYKAPWIRFTPYLIGIFFGHFFFHTKNKQFRLHWCIIVLMWILSGATAAAVIFGLYNYFRGPEHGLPIFTKATYNNFSKFGWTFFLGWIIFACERNWAGPLKIFMESGLWAPFSRLTYSIYLTHIFVMALCFSMRRQTVRCLSMTHALVREVIPVFVLSVVLAFFWSCTFEIPFAKIENIVFEKSFFLMKSKMKKRSIDNEQRNVENNINGNVARIRKVLH